MFINGELPKDEKYPLSCVYWIHREGMTDPKTQGYIGISVFGANVRFSKHKWSASNRSNDIVHKAMRKYSDICITTLVEADPEFCSSVEEMYRPTPNIAWNLCAGGVATRLGIPHTEETRLKVSRANIGTTRCLGYKHSEQARKNMSEAHKGIPQSEQTRKIKSKMFSKWGNPFAGALWKDGVQVFVEFEAGSRPKDMIEKFNTTEGQLQGLLKHFRNGWNPNLDQAYLSWLKEQKEQNDNTPQLI